MTNRSKRTTSHAVSRVFALMILGIHVSHAVFAGPISGCGCWRYSPPDGDSAQCVIGLSCIEWDLGGVTIASDCCDASLFGTMGPGCSPGCVASELDRPLFTVDLNDMANLSDMANPNQLANKSTQVEPFDINHTIPAIPLSIDGVIYLPEEIDRFTGVPLHFLMCRFAIEESVLYAFRSFQDLIKQAQRCAIDKSSFIVPGIPKGATMGIVLHDSEKWTGPTYFLAGGNRLDLSGSWWDERISSVRGVGDGTLVTFFESLSHTGSSLTISTDFGWNLSALGWDNRASAIMVWPLAKLPPRDSAK